MPNRLQKTVLQDKPRDKVLANAGLSVPLLCVQQRYKVYEEDVPCKPMPFFSFS